MISDMGSVHDPKIT